MDSLRPYTPTITPLTMVSCHHEYQQLQQTIRRQEEEIEQLQTLLLDVLNRYNYRSLRHSAIDYYGNLNQLRARLKRLRRDMICESTYCQKANEQVPCRDQRFGLSTTIERHATILIDEFVRIKDGCVQFLSGMMTLNLL
ncbi:hypothetical protein GCM10027341_51140 [Spirosoma knui]